MERTGHTSCTPVCYRALGLEGRSTSHCNLGGMGTTIGWYTEGGPMMLFILIVALTGLAVAVERIYVIVVRSKNNGRAFIERIIQLVRADKIDEAIKQCAASTAALPDMGLLILRSRSRDEADLQNIADAAALHVVPKLNRRTQYLPALAVAATLLGIIGTLSALRGAFVHLPSADADANRWAAIGQALTPTMFGLSVAVVLTLVHAYLVSQADFIREQIREFSARLINALIDRPDVRLGHR